MKKVLLLLAAMVVIGNAWAGKYWVCMTWEGQPDVRKFTSFAPVLVFAVEGSYNVQSTNILLTWTNRTRDANWPGSRWGIDWTTDWRTWHPLMRATNVSAQKIVIVDARTNATRYRNRFFRLISN
jgi:hypothetical protein